MCLQPLGVQRPDKALLGSECPAGCQQAENEKEASPGTRQHQSSHLRRRLTLGSWHTVPRGVVAGKDAGQEGEKSLTVSLASVCTGGSESSPEAGTALSALLRTSVAAVALCGSPSPWMQWDVSSVLLCPHWSRWEFVLLTLV